FTLGGGLSYHNPSRKVYIVIDSFLPAGSRGHFHWHFRPRSADENAMKHILAAMKWWQESLPSVSPPTHPKQINTVVILFGTYFHDFRRLFQPALFIRVPTVIAYISFA